MDMVIFFLVKDDRDLHFDDEKHCFLSIFPSLMSYYNCIHQGMVL